MGLDKYMAYIWHVSTTTVSYVIVNFLKKAQILISRYLSLIKTHVGREKKKTDTACTRNVHTEKFTCCHILKAEKESFKPFFS